MRAQETVFLSPVYEGLCSLVLGIHLWVSTAPCGVEKNGWVIYTLFPGSSVDVASEHLVRHTQMQPTGNLGNAHSVILIKTSGLTVSICTLGPSLLIKSQT